MSVARNVMGLRRTVLDTVAATAAALFGAVSVAQAQTGGLLDGLPDEPGVRVIVPQVQPRQNSPPSPAQSAPGAQPSAVAPAPTPSRGPTGDAQPAPPIAVSPAPAASPPASPPQVDDPKIVIAPSNPAPAAATPEIPVPSNPAKNAIGRGLAPSETRLVEEVYWYGFTLLPRDAGRASLFKDVFSGMKSKPNALGECLRDFERDVSLPASQPLHEWMFAELRGQHDPVQNVRQIAANHFEILVGPPPTGDKTARRCATERPPLQLAVLAHADKNGDLTNLKLKDVKGALEGLKPAHSRKWRLPRAIEAFAVASALPYDPPLARQLGKFWMQLDDKGEQLAILSATWDGVSGTFTSVDYELIKRNTAAPSAAPSARLIAVMSGRP